MSHKVKKKVKNPYAVVKARPCPQGSALCVKGVWYPCDMMQQMDPACATHEGWAHANREAEAVWQ